MNTASPIRMDLVDNFANRARERIKFKAEIRQLIADTQKLCAEKKELRGWGHWGVELVKVVAAVILGIGGTIGGLTGLQLAEFKVQKAEETYERLQIKFDRTKLELNEIEHKRQTAEGELARALKNSGEAQRQLGSLQTQIQKAKVGLAAVTQQLTAARKLQPTKNKASIEDAIGHTKTIEQDVDQANEQLKEMLLRLQRMNSGL